MELDDFRGYIESVRWKFARTMAKHPHCYTLKEWNPDLAKTFEAFVMYIRKHGYQRKFFNSVHTYLDVDGFTYWTMGAPLHKTILINREVRYNQYNEIADQYDLLFSDDETMKENERLFSIIEPYCKRQVLDVGCGTGTTLDYIKIPPQRYVGIDPAHLMLKRFKEKHPDYLNRVGFGKYEQMKGRHDTIIAMNGVMSYVQPEMFVKINRHLNRGGYYFLMFYKPDANPVSERSGKEIFHFRHSIEDLEPLFPNLTESGNYIIATNMEQYA